MTIFSESIVGPIAIPHRNVSADHAVAGRWVLHLLARGSFVLPSYCFIRMFWLMVEQS